MAERDRIVASRMSETAFETFFSTAQADLLPAAVPVACEDSDITGVVTTSFDVRDSNEALKIAVHDDPEQRAICAIYACRAVREEASVKYPGLHPV